MSGHLDQRQLALLEEWAQALSLARSQRLLGRFGPPSFAHAFVTRHVRSQVEGFLRALNRRLAVDPADADAAANRQSLERFRDSLEVPRPRWMIVSWVVAIVVLVQGAVKLVEATGWGEQLQPLTNVLSKSASGDPSSIGELASALASTDPADQIVLIAVFSFVSYLVLRGPAVGFAQARRLLKDSRSEAHMSMLYGAPRIVDLPFDLVVKAMLAFGAVAYGVIASSYQLTIGFDYVGPEIYAAFGIGALGVLRLGMIGVQWRRTRSRIAPFVVAFVVVAAVSLGAELSASRQQGRGAGPRTFVPLAILGEKCPSIGCAGFVLPRRPGVAVRS